MPAMAGNRRKHPRVRARGVAAHLRTPHGRGPCQVENVSLGGLFVRTDLLEQVGTEISVDIVRPGWKKLLTMAARVTSRVDAIEGRLSKRMPGMGLQFLQLDDKQFERLRALMRELGATEGGKGIALEDAIEGALREADLPPPGPVEMAFEEQPQAPKPAPRTVAPEPPAPAPASAPQAWQPPSELAPGSDAARLMVQVRGMVLQLAESEGQIRQRDLEIERLREELEMTRAALERALKRS
jgi:Tfp pilus assembly protein PilZ